MRGSFAVRLVAVVLLAFPACGGGGNGGPTSPTPFLGALPAAGFSPGTLLLRASPIDQAEIRWISPLGNMNPPAHTVPTDAFKNYLDVFLIVAMMVSVAIILLESVRRWLGPTERAPLPAGTPAASFPSGCC